MANGVVHRFFGGPPFWVIVRLAIISFIVGIVLSALGISPFDIVAWFQDLALRIYHLGFDAFDRLGQYFLLGAVIVIPIWLIARLFSMGGRGN